MIAVIDSSVFVRKLFNQPEELSEWSQIRQAYASRLVPLEMARVIDRCRLVGQIEDGDVVILHLEMRRLLRSVDLINITEDLLLKAGAPMPTVLGTLDSIHLSTALALRSRLKKDVILATHDIQLASAARASGLDVVGVD